MKKTIIVLGIILLVGGLTISGLVWGHGGRGYHMMGNWGNCPEYGRNYGELTSEQERQLDVLDRKLSSETSEMRNQMWAKSTEIDRLLKSATPNVEEVKALHKEISELRASLDEKALIYELESRKIAPEGRLGHMDGGWHGHQHMMEGFSPRMGYGPGACWN